MDRASSNNAADRRHSALRREACFALRVAMARCCEAGFAAQASQGRARVDIGAGLVKLRAGILAHGFLRLRCGDCGHDKLVAFSCKRRGFCPSYTAPSRASCSNRPG